VPRLRYLAAVWNGWCEEVRCQGHLTPARPNRAFVLLCYKGMGELMRRFGHLFSHSNQNARWQDDVIARLDSLVESQNQLRKTLTDHVAEGRPTPQGRQRAFIFLILTVGLIGISVTATLTSSTFKSEATIAYNQAQTASGQVSTDLQPIDNIVAKHGAEYLLTHPSNSVLSDVQAADGAAEQMSKDNANGNRLDLEWIASDYLGEVILAISSACFGAIAGWLFIPAFAGNRSRRRSRSNSTDP
jgi:hypothetical protein